MVQVLPYVPGFGERLGATLAQAGGSALEAFNKKHAQKQDIGIFQQLENAELSPLQKISMVGKLSQEGQKLYNTHYAPMQEKNARNTQINTLIDQIPEEQLSAKDKALLKASYLAE